VEAFKKFIDQFEIVHEDVTMRLFSKSLFGDVVVVGYVLYSLHE
jgi:hypothetical protein